MMPLFPFLLGAAATALLTTDSGRKLADRIGELTQKTAREKYDEVMEALKPTENRSGNDIANAAKEPENERNAPQSNENS